MSFIRALYFSAVVCVCQSRILSYRVACPKSLVTEFGSESKETSVGP
jgi:hypothetical protein